MQGSENDRLRLFEIPFTYTISGTLLVLAADPAKAKAKAEPQFMEELDNFLDSGVLWDAQDEPILKDELRGTLTVSEPSLSTYDIDTAGRASEFDADELALYEPHVGVPEAAQPEGAGAPRSTSGTVAPRPATSAPRPAPTAPPRPPQPAPGAPKK